MLEQFYKLCLFCSLWFHRIPSLQIHYQLMSPTRASDMSLSLTEILDNSKGLQLCQLILPSRLCLYLAKVHRGEKRLETLYGFSLSQAWNTASANILFVFSYYAQIFTDFLKQAVDVYDNVNNHKTVQIFEFFKSEILRNCEN